MQFTFSDRDNGATGAVEKEPETAVSIITPSDVNSSKSCPPTTEGNQSLLTDVEASSASVDKTEQSRLSKETDTQKSVTASQNQTPTENSSKQSSSGDAHKSHEKGEKSRLDLVSIAIVETSNISSIASTGVTQGNIFEKLLESDLLSFSNTSSITLLTISAVNCRPLCTDERN